MLEGGTQVILFSLSQTIVLHNRRLFKPAQVFSCAHEPALLRSIKKCVETGQMHMSDEFLDYVIDQFAGSASWPTCEN